MPPADSTEGCAAYGPNTSSRPNDANCEAQCRHDMRTLNVKRRWRVASAGSWPFALSEIDAKPNTGKDPGTKLLEISAILFIDIF